MHWWRSDNKGDGLRGHVHIGLPLNPVCWLLGHKAKATLEGDPRNPWLHVRCKVCDRRYTDPDYAIRTLKGNMSRAELKEPGERRLAAATANLEQWAKDRSGRAGYAERDLDVGYQLVWRGLERRSGRRRRWTSAGVSISIGNRGSETPVDLHFGTGFFALFITIGGVGGRAAHWLTNRDRGTYDSREIAVDVHGWKVWWSFWNKKHEWHSSTPRWRHGTASVHPLNYLYGGDPRGEKREVATATVFITPSSGGEYLTELTLEEWSRGRKRGPRDYHWSAKWDCRQGIPTKHDDGWKGGSIYGSSVSLTQNSREQVPEPPVWAAQAKALIEADIDQDRARQRFTLPA